MKTYKRVFTLCGLVAVMTVLGGCAAEVGSDEWCADMKEKPKGDWTMNEAKDFARHCILK